MLEKTWLLCSAGIALTVATPAIAQPKERAQTNINPSNFEEILNSDSIPSLNVETAIPFRLNFSSISSSEFDLTDTTESDISSPLISKSLFQNIDVILAHGNGEGTGSDWTSGRPDGHAPIGVMGDHIHGAGEWMLSYRYRFMSMDGNRDGTDNLSTDDVLDDFMVTPEDMSMEMHMFGVMYAPTDDLTLMAMLPFVSKEMDHVTRSGVEFTTNSEGLGDIKLTGLYNLVRANRQRVHLNLGMSFPTGSIEERDDTPAGDDRILPYPMQIGSGTVDLRPGITYLGQTENWSWGAQANTVLRLGENENDYSLGNRYQLIGWIAHQFSEQVSLSLRLDGETWEDYDGADSRLNPNMIPTADPDLRGGTRLDLGVGANLYLPEGSIPGARLAVEFEIPVYQSLNGPQLETDWQFTVGVQAAF